jgi:hypothetical protein
MGGRKMKKFVKVLGIGVLSIGVLAACGEADIQKVDGSASGNKTEQKADKKQDETKNLKIGETAKINNTTVKVIGVREIKNDMLPPTNGKYIGVELEIVNEGDEPAPISTAMQMALRADGYEQDIALIDTKGSLDVEIAPGETVKGEVAFDSKKANEYQFIFSDGIQTGQAIWKFTDADVKLK